MHKINQNTCNSMIKLINNTYLNDLSILIDANIDKSLKIEELAGFVRRPTQYAREVSEHTLCKNMAGNLNKLRDKGLNIVLLKKNNMLNYINCIYFFDNSIYS